jgi:replicative DNA helicase
MTQEQVNFSEFGKPFQEKLAFTILEDYQFANQIGEVLDYNFFELKYLRVFVKKIYDYKDAYKKYPSRATFEALLRTELDEENSTLQTQVRSFYAQFVSGGNTVDTEYVKKNAIEFCKKQKLKEAMLKSVELLKRSSFDEIRRVVDNALKLGNNPDVGYLYEDHFEERYEIKAREAASTGWDVIDGMTRGGLAAGELGVVIAPTGCHSKGTKILMFDGTFKNVEQIVVGDKVMGPDNKERNVLSLHRGSEEMYEVIPTKGKPFTVNSGHILSLVGTNDGSCYSNKVENITVRDYLKKSKTYKHIHKLYRSDLLEFGREHVDFAYELGLLIGDGCFSPKRISFVSADNVLIESIEKMGSHFDSKISKRKDNRSKNLFEVYFGNVGKNTVRDFIEKNGLLSAKSGDKFIPEKYKLSPSGDRLKLLAGLIDTDGSLSSNGFDFITKSKRLSEDVVFVCQSLGLAAYASETQKKAQSGHVGTYYRVFISGNTDIIPTKLNRKTAAQRKQIKNHLRTGFTVKPVGVDEYYGFEVDCDNLYVMEDFFVTHNSGKTHILCHLGAAAVKQGRTVIHYSLELDDKTIGRRYDAAITGIPLDSLMAKKDVVFEKIKEVPGSLIIKEYPTKSASPETLRNHLTKLKERGIIPGMIIVDYGDLLRPTSTKKEKREELETIYEELRAIAKENNCPCYTASQTNRSGLNAEVITMESISEAFNKCFVADFIFTVSRTVDDKRTNTGRIFVAKNRFGMDGVICPIFMDTSAVSIKVFEPTSETKEDIEKNSSKKQMKRLKEKYYTNEEEPKKKAPPTLKNLEELDKLKNLLSKEEDNAA